MLWLGIDGGGTKTACALFDDDLRQLDALTLPTCHYAQVGTDGTAAVLARAVRWAEERAAAVAGGGSAPEPVGLGIGFGICGYGEAAEASRGIERACAAAAGAHPFELVNDVDAAWAAGLGLRDGIAVIAGTGSIALGVRGGARMRCGGWDYELGDEGSGGWLGKELLRAFTRQSDGRDPRGPLHGLVRRELGLADDFDVIPFAQAHFATRGDISRLAPLVTRAAEAGDASARGILERAAREEADLVRAIVRGLFEPSERAEGVEGGTVPVTYVGGTFAAGGLILEPLAAALPCRCELTAPEHGPALGPVLLLRRQLERGGASA